MGGDPGSSPDDRRSLPRRTQPPAALGEGVGPLRRVLFLPCPVRGLISDRAYAIGDGQTPSMTVSKLMVVALGNWINRQREHVVED